MTNIIETRRCGLCRKIDKKDNLAETHCELTGLHGYDHEQCLKNDWDNLMGLVELGLGCIVIVGDGVD